MNSSEIRVLLVDDNPDDVSIIRRLLAQYQRANFQVLSASSTGSCLELLEADGADLLLLDYLLPAEDGISFLRRASAIVDLPPVIIVTGLADHRLLAEAIRSGASDCIYKSAMTSQTLGKAVQQALAKFRHDADLSRYDDNIVHALAETAQRVDPTAGGARVAAISVQLGLALDLGDHQVCLLRVGGLLHEIGKLGVRREVICKPGPLTPDEEEEVRAHPLIGERLCAPLRLSREIGPMIRLHHERWDGHGYVDGLAGQDIPFLARIVGVADAFDAMTMERPYRSALPAEEALRQLESGAGSQWDPEVVAVLVQLAKQGKVE